MTAYVIADVDVLDRGGYQEYADRFDAILARFGGEILVVGGSPTPVEGEWIPDRLVILAFPNRAAADAWYRSPEYAEIAPIRHQHARTHFITQFDGWRDSGG
jgi:uncharacterized protein (DUF1330 family)